MPAQICDVYVRNGARFFTAIVDGVRYEIPEAWSIAFCTQHGGDARDAAVAWHQQGGQPKPMLIGVQFAAPEIKALLEIIEHYDMAVISGPLSDELDRAQMELRGAQCATRSEHGTLDDDVECDLCAWTPRAREG